MLDNGWAMFITHGRCDSPQSTFDEQCSGYGRCRQPTSSIGWPLCAGHGRCRKAKPNDPWVMCRGHGISKIDIGWVISIGYRRCDSLQPIPPGLCCLLLAYVACLNKTRFGWYCLSLADIDVAWTRQDLDDIAFRWPILMSPWLCTQATSDACRPCMMQSIVVQCCLPKAHRPWLMLSDIGCCKYRKDDAHTQRLMHAGIVWCYITLVNVAY